MHSAIQEWYIDWIQFIESLLIQTPSLVCLQSPSSIADLNARQCIDYVSYAKVLVGRSLGEAPPKGFIFF